MKNAFLFPLLVLALSGCTVAAPTQNIEETPSSSSSSVQSVTSSRMPSKAGCFPGSCDIPPMTDAEVRAVLSPAAYKVMREAGTERPYSSPLNDEHRAGTFVAADTGEPLFRSEAKFDSGTGWPSFFEPISPDVIVLKTDRILGYPRTEVLTRNGSHLGHVFEDGPEPTGLRYCMNGLALRFIPDEN